MTKEFNSLEEIQKYYNEETNTYVFKENDEYINIQLNFNLFIEANIHARNIYASDIKALDIIAYDIHAFNINARDIHARDIYTLDDIEAWDIHTRDIYAFNINAWDIHATDIHARNISYFAVCIAYHNIVCKSIEARRDDHIHMALSGKIEVKE